MWRTSPGRQQPQPVNAMKKLCIFALLLTLCACAKVDPSLTDQTKVYTDMPVRKSALQVSLHPKGKQYRPLNAYIHPFAIQQQTIDYEHLADTFGEIFHHAWLEEQMFTIQEFGKGKPYHGLSRALDEARRRGADLLVLAKVPYFYAGHTLDDTAITLQVDIYAAGNGQLLWSMVQSGRIEDRFPDDYIYFRHEFRLSTSPFNLIIRDIAKDMAIPLKAWLPDPDVRYNFASTAKGMEANLTGQPMADGQDTKDGAKPADDTNGSGMEKSLPDDGAAPMDDTPRPDVKGVNLKVEFDFDKATIRSESYPVLDALGEALNSDELKGKNIIIGGHTDARGSDSYNNSLSKKRAESVKAYLVNKWGIDPALIEAVGYGKARPLTTETTEEAMQMNRRVEIRLAE